MSQFDDFFNKKLNEEQSFAGQKRSWTQLNRDLQLLEKGTAIGARSLTLWKAVSIVAILISVALVWERQHLVDAQEKSNLVVTQLQEKLQGQNTPVAQHAVKQPENILDRSISAPMENPSAATATRSNEILYSNKVIDSAKSTRKPRQIASKENDLPKLSNPDNATVAPSIQVTLPALHPQPNDSNSNSIAAKRPDVEPNAPVNSSALSSIPIITTQEPVELTADTARFALKDSTVKVDSSAIKMIEKPDSSSSKPMAEASSPIIDPVHKKATRWNVGVRLIAGFPQPEQQGVSMIQGQGLSVSYRFWHNFSLTTAAEFLKFEVNADSIPKHCSDIKLPPHGQGHHFSELKNVTSSREIRQYNIGLNYTQPLIGRLNASCSVAHTWAFLPSRQVSLRFEELHGPGPGGPDEEYQVRQTPKKWVSNVWRLGVGLQYETSRWIFGARGDYAKHFNNSSPTVDATFASAEVLYKF
jgi:hypothetical protein